MPVSNRVIASSVRRLSLGAPAQAAVELPEGADVYSIHPQHRRPV